MDAKFCLRRVGCSSITQNLRNIFDISADLDICSGGFTVVRVRHAALPNYRFKQTSLLEVPVGFTLAMSCVLANRVLLNVKEAGRTVRTLSVSRKPLADDGLGDTSFGSPGTLSQFEMKQLRSMRVQHPMEDIFEASDEEYDMQNVPWVVR